MSGQCFNLQLVYKHLDESSNNGDDVNMKKYIKCWRELNKFFLCLGSIFSYVSDDVTDKINILEKLRNENKIHFQTVKKMIVYEKENGLLTKDNYVSGSRTLLRLHRAMAFIKLFLKRVYDLKDCDGTASVCRAAYNETLSQHHSFWVKNAASIGMICMPTRGNLLNNVCAGDKELIKASLEVLPDTLVIADDIYNRVEKLYTDFKLHDLP